MNLEPNETFMYPSLTMPQFKHIAELLSSLLPQYLQINKITSVA